MQAMQDDDVTAQDDDVTAQAPPRAPASSGRAVLIGVLLTAAVLVAAGALAVRGGQDEPPPMVVDPDQPTLQDRPASTDTAPLPEVRLAGFFDDEAVALADYRGQPLVVNFWGTWCPPCVEEMPDFQKVADSGGDAFGMLGVNLLDDLDKAHALVDELGIDYDLAVDEGGSLFDAVEGFGMPTTLLVDPEGQIRYRHTGPLDAEGLERLLDEQLGVERAAP